MEKRFLLTIVLCLAILMFYQSFVIKKQETWEAEREPSWEEQEGAYFAGAPGAQEPGVARDERWVTPEASSAWSPGAQPPAAPERETVCQDVVVDTPLYRAVFCSHNGRLMSWRLKRYTEIQDSRCALIGGFGRNDPGRHMDPRAGDWVERVHVLGPEEYPLALEMSTDRRRVVVEERLKPDRFFVNLPEGAADERIVFAGTDSEGRAVRRTYTFRPDQYLVDLDVEIEGLPAELLTGGVALLLTDRVGMWTTPDRYTFSGFMAVVDGKLVKKKDVAQEEVYAGAVNWGGFSDKYFLSALIPQQRPHDSALDIPQADLEDTPQARPMAAVLVDYDGSGAREHEGLWVSRLVYSTQEHTQGDRSRFASPFVIGPKDMDVLKESGHALRRSIDLGWFGFIAEPLLVVLKFFYSFTHNYGVAIILLTIIIKVLFYPLTHKQFESMKDLQKLQPKMKALREKYKNDKEKLNREVMDLYRTHKINPLGGCWPVLLQIPVFFALYKALLHSIELRQAPFILWIQDLSEKDPCYITPLIMGATMFLQQKMTPMAGDPAQQKIMMLMPVVFTFVFLNFPSGLVLYWLVNNVLTIGQQYVTQKRQSS